MPNIFSPNFDGLNDVFTVYGDNVINRVVRFQVYDRYGSLLFSAEDFLPGDESNGWDGTVRGRRAQSGIYVYYAELEFLDGELEIVKGDVLLVD